MSDLNTSVKEIGTQVKEISTVVLMMASSTVTNDSTKIGLNAITRLHDGLEKNLKILDNTLRFSPELTKVIPIVQQPQITTDTTSV